MPRRVALRSEIFLGDRAGRCQNCNERWGHHSGIACIYGPNRAPSTASLDCPVCGRGVHSHNIYDCVLDKEIFDLPVEFVELWGEIGRAHEAACYCQTYTPKRWPNPVAKAAKETYTPAHPPGIRGMSYDGTYTVEATTTTWRLVTPRYIAPEDDHVTPF